MSGLGVQGGLGQQNQVLPRGDVQLEDVEPDLLHVIVFCDDVMLNAVLQGQAFIGPSHQCRSPSVPCPSSCPGIRGAQ